MVRISRRVLLATGLTPALPLKAEDPWKAKSPSEWSEKEIVRVLSDSPWARKVEISMSGPPMGGGGGRGRGRGGGGGGGGIPSAEQGNPGGMGGGGGMGGDSAMGGSAGGGGMAPTVSFLIRWVSAVPVKEAFVRARLGKEAESSQQAKEYLARTETHYVIALIGPPRQAPQREGAQQGAPKRGPSDEMKEKIKAITTLHRKGKSDLHPEAVEFVEGAGQTMVFRFARTDEITLEDKDVEFVTRLGQTDIKRKFSLKDMVFQGRLSL